MSSETRRRFNKVDDNGRIYCITHGKVSYLDTNKGRATPSWWDDIARQPNYGKLIYPTQKPVKLLERVIIVSSNPGDVVLDPFCGSGTTLVAAQNLGRQWIGIDASEEAIAVARGRLGLSDV